MTEQTDKTVVTLQAAAGTHVDGIGRLKDGRYQLTIIATQVSAEGFSLDGNRDGAVGDDYVFGADAADRFFRFFGVSDVDGQDYGNFGLRFLKRLAQ
ncbi:hypothetical protein NZK35_16355 [Stieleria sp. ICT_E10.1]|uniref:hypothetical protein n=1 Tax=Stieleria sedimenti TaxID=2976331 RepID=UPI002180707F|nr:hypothetical protein [Stieleria sedimenti]MCS7468225.1 hypothetical protein [Stieleria sedimenti]